MTLSFRRCLVAVLLSVALPGRADAQGHAHAGHTPGPNPEAAAVVRAIQTLFAAAERGDLAALDSLYAGDSLLVMEGAGINRGWVDYRDNHLAPELEKFQNFRYRPFDIEARVSGNLAWATFRYAIAADLPTRKLDAVGRGTAILERHGDRWIVRLTHTASRDRRPNDPPMP
jgi:ketosteroid isomerase-like protein